MRRLFALAAIVVISGLALLLLESLPPPQPSTAATSSTLPPIPAPAASSASSGSTSGKAETGVDAPIVLADGLNAPDSTIHRDLQLLQEIFFTWLTNFPHEGNPVGDNAEITAALMGQNRLELVLIPKGHRALNGQGELCDRWGTPFRFHQLSGTQMEIISAGPDRRFGTTDDASSSPVQ